jgi:hypothetical protein
MQLSLLLFLQLLIHPFGGFLQQLLVFRPCLLGRGSMPRPTADRSRGLAVCATLLHPLCRKLRRSHQNLPLLLVFLLPYLLLLLSHSSALLHLARERCRLQLSCISSSSCLLIPLLSARA